MQGSEWIEEYVEINVAFWCFSYDLEITPLSNRITIAASCLTLQMILGRKWAQTKAQIKAPDRAKRNIITRILEQNWQREADLRKLHILKDSPEDIVPHLHMIHTLT